MTISKLFIILFVIGIQLIHAQKNIEILQEIGFENLSEINEQDHYYLTYENNRYRYEGDALITVIESIEIPETAGKISILIQNRGIGISSVEFLSTNLKSLQLGQIDAELFAEEAKFSFNVDALIAKFDSKERANESFTKVETIVGLDLNYALGNFDNSVRQKINFQPELISVLGKGGVLSGRYNIPTFNEIDQETDYLQIARITQDIRFKYNVFLNLNFGYFTQNRFGLATRIDRYLGSERLRMRFDFGITRSVSLDKNFKLAITNNINTFNMSGGIIYRMNKYDTDFSFRYGTYLYGDIGYKASMIRQFDEVFVGLFLNSTSFGKIAGFNFQVPLSLKRHMKNKGFRVRTKDYFFLDYNYRYDSNVATEYYTGSSIIEQIKEYYPEVLRKKIASHLNK